MSITPRHANNNGVILASSTEPKLSQRTGTFGKHSGRRLTSGPSSQDKKDDGGRIFPTNASMEEIDKMLEDDAFALLNIKKEITNSQQDELTKLRVAVMAAKKEYDSMHIANNILEKEVNSFQAKIISLQGVDKSSLANNFAMQDVVNDLAERNSEVLTELAAEQRTIKMLSLMIKRYDAEIAQCRLDTAKANTHVEHAKHDLTVCEHSAQNHRQELLELEMEHEKMQSTVKQRQDQREGKITMLHTLSAEGEQSVARLQQSLMETAKVSESRCSCLHEYFYRTAHSDRNTQRTSRE
jgi:chromosome segregation ATPase